MKNEREKSHPSKVAKRPANRKTARSIESRRDSKEQHIDGRQRLEDAQYLLEGRHHANRSIQCPRSEIKRATIGLTSRRTARRINRLKGIVADIPPAYDTRLPPTS